MPTYIPDNIAPDSQLPVDQIDNYMLAAAGEGVEAGTPARPASERVGDFLTYSIPASLTYAGFQFAEGLTPWTQEDTKQFVDKNYSVQMANFMQEHEAGLRLSAEIPGMFVPIGLSSKLMRSKQIFNATEKVLGKKAANFFLPAQQSQTEKMSAVVDRLQLLAMKQQKSFGKGADEVLDKVTGDYTKTAWSDNLKLGLAADLSIYASMNESQFLFPDELSAIQNAAMYVVPTGIFAVGAGAMARYKVKEQVLRLNTLVKEAGNKADLPIDKMYSAPGERDTAAVVVNSMIQQKTDELKQFAGDPIATSNIQSQLNELRGELKLQIDLMAEDKLINKFSSQHTLEADEFNTVYAATQMDDLVLADVKSIEPFNAGKVSSYAEAIPQEFTRLQKQILEDLGVLNKFTDQTSKEYKDKLRSITNSQEQLKRLENLHAVVLERDGSMVAASMRKSTFDDLGGVVTKPVETKHMQRNIKSAKPGTIVTIKNADETIELNSYAAKYTDRTGNQSHVLVDENFALKGPTRVTDTKTGKVVIKNVELAPTVFNILNLEARTAANAAYRHAIADWKPATAQPITITTQMNHPQLDAILELADKFGHTSPEFASKFKFGTDIRSWDDVEFLSLSKKFQAFKTESDRIASNSKSPIKLSDAQQTTTHDLVIGLNLPNDGVGTSNYVIDAFATAYQTQTKSLGELYDSIDALKKGAADSAGISVEEVGLVQWRGTQMKAFAESRKPVTLLVDTKPTDIRTRAAVVEETLRLREMKFNDMKLAGREDAILIQLITENTLRDPDRLKVASDVQYLVDGIQTRRDRLTQTMNGLELSPQILGIDGIANGNSAISMQYVKEKFKQLEAASNQILSINNKADLDSFATLRHVNHQGWRLNGEFIPVETNGKIIGYKVGLEDHQFNKDLWAKARPDVEFDKAYGVAQFKGKDLVVTPLAAQLAREFNLVSQDVLKHFNFVRKLYGKSPIPAKIFHLPPKDLEGKEVVYIIDSNTGRPLSVADGNTPAQAKYRAQEEIQLLKEQNVDAWIATSADVKSYHLFRNEAFADLTDFNKLHKLSGASKGRQVGQQVETGKHIVINMQDSLIKQYDSITKQTMGLLFESELKYANMAKNSAGIISKQEIAKRQTVWDQWANRLFGVSSGNEQQTIGKLWSAGENLYDETVQRIFDSKILRARGGISEAEATKRFEDLDKHLPAYNPVKDIADYAETFMKIKPPHSMRKHMSTLNAVTSLATLRMGEIGLGLLNVFSLPMLIPAVQKALNRRAGQGIEEWKQLNSAISSPITDDIAIWNPVKATTSAIHFFFNRTPKGFWDEAAAKGHLWQETAEKAKLLTAPSQGYGEKMVKHAAELTSMFVDKTEIASRAISYGFFYNVGKSNLLLRHDAAMDFAHHMANRVIGDYRPNNRPQIYQGAVGMPLGMFTTFAWNYLQRVFGYVEKGQFGALMNQFGIQSAMFGIKSVPGVQQYIDHFTDNYDGSFNMVDNLNKNLGYEMTDLLMYGSIGSLLDTAIHTRATMGLPFSHVNSVASMAAPLSLLQKTYQGLADTASSLKTNGGLNTREVSEIMARTFPIRSVRGWLEIMNGQSVDKTGMILEENTRSALAFAAKASNFRTMNEQKTIEEFARQRSQRIKQMELKSNMSRATRAAIRDGKFGVDHIEQMAKQGFQAGMEPDNFMRWVSDQYINALVNKNQLEVLDAANDPSRMGDYMRMMHILSNQD